MVSLSQLLSWATLVAVALAVGQNGECRTISDCDSGCIGNSKRYLYCQTDKTSTTGFRCLLGSATNPGCG
ncbi:hypothetical protein CDEST_12059 [Colletotrichum destructivum]|uniref:Uncharacterized protein n=1 Tax=Colletotrichum destructivum TaxID=34406 RepID=A0AAX4IUU7_9PEZI|nr:hypothetical protein CDEST_12059 [Colletotrichum destructivum]